MLDKKRIIECFLEYYHECFKDFKFYGGHVKTILYSDFLADMYKLLYEMSSVNSLVQLLFGDHHHIIIDYDKFYDRIIEEVALIDKCGYITNFELVNEVVQINVNDIVKQVDDILKVIVEEECGE